MPATGVFRAVRRSLKKRGVGTGQILSAAALVSGILAGALTWTVIKGAVLEYRAETGLRFGPAARAEEAAAALSDRVGNAEFQSAWRRSAEAGEGLSGSGRLEVDIVDASAGEARLVCHGRPRIAAIRALAWARDRLTDPRTSGIAPLQPEGHARRLGDARKRLAEYQAALKAARDAEAALPAARKDWPGRKAAADADLAKAQVEVGLRRAEMERARTAVGEERRLALRGEIDKLAAVVGKAAPPTPAEELKLAGERSRLERLMTGAAREDCTPDHPVVRRLDEIAARLKQADLARQLAECDGRQEQLKFVQSQLEAAQARRDAAGREADKFEQERKAADAASNEAARIAVDVKTAGTEVDRLAAVPAIPVTVTMAGGISEDLERSWLIWPCLGGGLAAGLVLMVLVRRYHFLRHSRLDSRSGLARCLHLPVLGVIPDLPDLAAKQE
ncbi:MAG TPA: hypothetical protein PK280_03230 [Planctomycetota bacterium]|nr:hypothetical protein [Planctomycetota bacterium]